MSETIQSCKYHLMSKNRLYKNTPIQTFTQEKTEKQPQYQSVTSLVRAFQKQIYQPISLRQTIMKNSEQQRCMLHNIIFSVYCTVCRKILCASCMYTSSLHRKHRVIPIQAAIEEIREDLRNFQLKIPKVLKNYDAITISCNEYLVQIEKDMSPIVGKLQQFYEGLRTFIKAKQKQQIAKIKQKRDEIRAQVNAYNKEIIRVYQYIQEKCKSYANHNIKIGLLVPSRNIIQNLLLASQFTKLPSFINQSTKYSIDPQMINGALVDIAFKIDQFVVMPVFSKRTTNPPNKTAVSTPRSVDLKSFKMATLSPRNKVEIPSFEQKKRLNSSVAGVRTHRK